MAPDISLPDAGEAASVWIGEVMRLVAGASSADKYGGSFEREIAGVESGLPAHFVKRQNVPKSVDFIAHIGFMSLSRD